MDKVVEEGFDRLTELVTKTKLEQNAVLNKIAEGDAALLKKMIESVAPVISEAGQEFMLKAKQDSKGDLYDQKYYDFKMILLGKTEHPVEFRPDNPKKKVEQQYCVLSEKGELFELMFSNDGFIVDTYAAPLSIDDALEFYGYDILYMLFSAMREYSLAQQDLLDALNITLGFMQNNKE
ncbi:MAG: hypothetical protein Q4Q53_02790 [Methanocorpusculum sp.]|nr:hypothetical protein [Methanocorpusculum sp.]